MESFKRLGNAFAWADLGAENKRAIVSEIQAPGRRQARALVSGVNLVLT